MNGPCCGTCGYDEAIPEGAVDEFGMPITCSDPFHQSARTFWEFGTIIRVDPKTNPKVPQPDDRRWLVLVAANTSANRQWTFLSLGRTIRSSGEPIISHWSSSYGFVRAEE